MTSQEKASLTQRTRKLVNALCNKYKGTRPEKNCRGCRLHRTLLDHDYDAMKVALQRAKA